MKPMTKYIADPFPLIPIFWGGGGGVGGGLIGILHVIEYSSFYSPNETTSLTFEFCLMASTFSKKKK
jgi:hypothetical protein